MKCTYTKCISCVYVSHNPILPRPVSKTNVFFLRRNNMMIGFKQSLLGHLCFCITYEVFHVCTMYTHNISYLGGTKSSFSICSMTQMREGKQSPSRKITERSCMPDIQPKKK